MAQHKQHIAAAAKKQAELQKVLQKFHSVSIQESELREQEQKMKEIVATKLKQLEEYNIKVANMHAHTRAKQMQVARMAFLDRFEKK